MHRLQEKLLRLAQDRNLGKFSLRAIGEMVGEGSPQLIKHHLNQLEKKGLIRIDRERGIIARTGQKWVTGLLRNAQLLAIPIVGSANAGNARKIAEQSIEGYLRVSSTMIPASRNRRLFALKVDGPSMNRAVIDGKTISDGDYVVIDSAKRNPQDGDVVLSVIDGMANLKKFFRDKENRQIVLVSESTHSFPPIHIHENDDFFLNGTVIQVVKKPRLGM